MTMNAIITDITPGVLTVRNLANNETVVVFYSNTRRFTIGDRIRITFSGIATMSIPPQITASHIQITQSAPIVPPVQRNIRAVVVRRENNFLIVRNNANGQLLRVNTRYARFFCPGRQVTIRHSGISPGIPPRVNAIEILPVC